MKFKNYLDLRSGLEALPKTWYPDLIRAMIETAYRNNIFIVPGGASKFVANVEKRIERKAVKNE